MSCWRSIHDDSCNRLIQHFRLHTVILITTARLDLRVPAVSILTDRDGERCVCVEGMERDSWERERVATVESSGGEMQETEGDKERHYHSRQAPTLSQNHIHRRSCLTFKPWCMLTNTNKREYVWGGETVWNGQVYTIGLPTQKTKVKVV